MASVGHDQLITMESTGANSVPQTAQKRANVSLHGELSYDSSRIRCESPPMIMISMFLSRPNDSYKCSSVRGGAESSASDSRKEDLMESMFFDVESLSSRTPSTRSDTGAQLNDAFEIDLETTPKELMSSSEDVNSVDAIVQQDESPLPSLHSDSESSVLSLHDNGELYEETNDSGVETSPGSSDKQSQHSPTLISPSVTDNDACVDLAEEPKPGPSRENHCGSTQEKQSVCRVILDDDQDIVECWWYSHVKYAVLMCVLSIQVVEY